MAKIKSSRDTETDPLDATKAALMTGDAKYVISQLQMAFEDVFDADTFPDGGERDACVLRALRRLHTAQSTLATGLENGGAS